ncbi:STAS domain-containing protein [Streptomyces sp. NPDC059389]|uniref:STAS domain-containing protein n=1 Tax=Streptomyces sp. NPDC059389 TaxID=3346818 RepID=UPI003690545D
MPAGGAGHGGVLSGEFDADTVHVFREILAATDTAVHLVVDLTGVTFADSSLLHALLDARRRIVLVGPLHGRFHRLLEVTGTTCLFTTAPGVGVQVDVALARFP